MKIIRNLCELKPCSIALGNFDGVHIAHKEIIEKCRDYAKNNGILSGVLLFENHTQTVIDNKKFKVLSPLPEKIEMIKELGVDFVFIKQFDDATMKMTKEDFFEFLITKMKAKALFAGYDYTFGYKALGKSKDLLEMGKKNGVYVEITDEIEIFDKPISSTAIREMVKLGETEKIKKYLGRGYCVCGIIEKGKQNGTKMGIPTANLKYDADKLLPSDGVYLGEFIINKNSYKSLINIGKNPTFDADKRTLEVHIPDFCENIYDKEAKVLFDRKIRDEIKFKTPEELTKQIKKDLEILKKGK